MGMKTRMARLRVHHRLSKCLFRSSVICRWCRGQQSHGAALKRAWLNFGCSMSGRQSPWQALRLSPATAFSIRHPQFLTCMPFSSHRPGCHGRCSESARGQLPAAARAANRARGARCCAEPRRGADGLSSAGCRCRSGGATSTCSEMSHASKRATGDMETCLQSKLLT